MSKVISFVPRKFEDNRGWFSETYNASRENSYGVTSTFVQDNSSLSVEIGTIRGIHFQTPPRAQAKLVRCTQGRIIDYVVDLRAGSPTMGKYVEVELSAENGRQVFVPEGFGHGFITLEPRTEVSYKVSDFYAPANDGGIRYDCPVVDIAWPLPKAELVLSVKGLQLPTLAEFDSPFAYDGVPLELVTID